MPILVLNHAERQRLEELYFEAHALGAQYPYAREEIMTAIRCLKAVHSNAIEDKSIDRVFLQILLHDALYQSVSLFRLVSGFAHDHEVIRVAYKLKPVGL